VVAKHADRYNHPCGSVKLLKRMISKLKEHCATIGRHPKEIKYSILVSCVVGNDDKIITIYLIKERSGFMVCNK